MQDTQTKVENKFGVNLETSGALANTTPNQSSIKSVADSLNALPTTLNSVYTEYKNIFVLALVLVSAGVGLRVVLSVLGAIEGIPLLAPSLELVGLGYASWFIYRYLLWADTRKELTSDIDQMKSRFTGKKL